MLNNICSEGPFSCHLYDMHGVLQCMISCEMCMTLYVVNSGTVICRLPKSEAMMKHLLIVEVCAIPRNVNYLHVNHSFSLLTESALHTL